MNEGWKNTPEPTKMDECYVYLDEIELNCPIVIGHMYHLPLLSIIIFIILTYYYVS